MFVRKLLVALVAIPLMGSSVLLMAQEVEPLKRSLRPIKTQQEQELFQDMVVVQNKAMNKSNRFLLSSYASMDFSDGPYTLWSWNVNPGFAINDFWEVYLSVAPLFYSQKRDIVNKLNKLNEKGYTITAAKPRYQYGAEILWSPLYGKDSLGTNTIIRSDTFVKVGVHNIQYDKGNGLKFHLGVGKTYFLTKNLGFRPALTANYIQTIIDTKKEFQFFAIVELGVVVYF